MSRASSVQFIGTIICFKFLDVQQQRGGCVEEGILKIRAPHAQVAQEGGDGGVVLN